MTRYEIIYMQLENCIREVEKLWNRYERFARTKLLGMSSRSAKFHFSKRLYPNLEEASCSGATVSSTLLQVFSIRLQQK